MTYEDLHTLRRCAQLVRDLIDPEQFGHAVPAEVRDAARRALGIKPCEAVKVESFNEADARRAALEGK